MGPGHRPAGPLCRPLHRGRAEPKAGADRPQFAHSERSPGATKTRMSNTAAQCHTGPVYRVTVSEDGRMVLVAATTAPSGCGRPPAGQLLAALQGHAGGITTRNTDRVPDRL